MEQGSRVPYLWAHTLPPEMDATPGSEFALGMQQREVVRLRLGLLGLELPCLRSAAAGAGSDETRRKVVPLETPEPGRVPAPRLCELAYVGGHNPSNIPINPQSAPQAAFGSAFTEARKFTAQAGKFGRVTFPELRQHPG